jgi:hypothetical protein
MEVSLKTEKRSSHITVARFRPWVRRAEGYRGTCQLKPCMEVLVKPRRPPSLPIICMLFPDQSSFSVLRETSVTFSCDHFKKLKCYVSFISPVNLSNCLL